MPPQDSTFVIEAWEKSLNNKDWKTFENLHSENVVLQSPDSPQPVKGRKQLRQWYETYQTAFPDMTPSRQRLFAQGEWVCAEYRITGTHKGPFPGAGGKTIPATNKKIAVTNCTVYRVQAGKVTEVHEYFDQLGFMQQLGLAPK